MVKKYTLVWYADDNEISYKDIKVVDSIIMEIEKRFGKMAVTRFKENVFVVMYIKFLDKARVRILLKYYLTKII